MWHQRYSCAGVTIRARYSGVRRARLRDTFGPVLQRAPGLLMRVTDSRERAFQIAPRTLLRAKPSKGGDAEPRGYSGSVRYARRAASDPTTGRPRRPGPFSPRRGVS